MRTCGSNAEKRCTFFVIFALILIGGATRLLYIDSHSVWIDEYITLERALLPAADLIKALYLQGPGDQTPDYSPPLYHLILHFSLLFGKNDLFARLPGIVFSVLTIPVLWGIGRQLFNNGVGLCAAAMYSVSLYMIHYARNIRPYGVVLFFIMFGMYCCYMAVKTQRLKYWIGYALSYICSMYMLLTSIGNMAGLGLGVIAYSLCMWRSQKGRAIRTVLLYSAFTLLALLCYLPWAKAHSLVVALSYYDFPPTGVSTVTYEAFENLFFEFSAFLSKSHLLRIVMGVLCILGLVRVWFVKKWLELCFLGLFAVCPLVLFMMMDTSYPFFSRRLITAYFLMLFFAALGVDFLRQLMGHLGKKWAHAFLLCAMFVIMCLNVYTLPAFYGARLSEYKDQMIHVFSNRYNSDYFYSSSKVMDFFVSWYLPGVFNRLGQVGSKEYKRVLVESHPDEALFNSSLDKEVGKFSKSGRINLFYVAGLVNRSPLTVFSTENGRFMYEDNFEDFKVFRDASTWENIVLSRGKHGLEPGKRGSNAFVEYDFAIPDPPLVSSCRVKVSVSFRQFFDLHSTDKVRIIAIRDGGVQELLGAITPDDIISDSVQLPDVPPYTLKQKEFIFNYSLHNSELIKIRLEIESGLSRSIMILDSFSLEISGLDVKRNRAATAMEQLDSLFKNHDIRLWEPATSAAAGKVLYAFWRSHSATSHNSRIGSVGLRQSFLERNPGCTPVHTVSDDYGQVIDIFDQNLVAQFVDIETVSSSSFFLPQNSINTDMFELEGQVHFPRLLVNGEAFDFPFHFPSGSIVNIAPGVSGLVLFRPLFENGKFSVKQFNNHADIRLNPVDPCVQCVSSRECSLEYIFHSRYPMDGVLMTYHPRVFNDAAGANKIDVLVSHDGVSFKRIDGVSSDKSGIWSEIGLQRTVFASSVHPHSKIWIRFILSNEGCQLWSSSEYPMVLSSRLNTKSAVRLEFPGQFTVHSHQALDNDFALRVYRPSLLPGNLLRTF